MRDEFKRKAYLKAIRKRHPQLLEAEIVETYDKHNETKSTELYTSLKIEGRLVYQTGRIEDSYDFEEFNEKRLPQILAHSATIMRNDKPNHKFLAKQIKCRALFEMGEKLEKNIFEMETMVNKIHEWGETNGECAARIASGKADRRIREVLLLSGVTNRKP